MKQQQCCLALRVKMSGRGQNTMENSNDVRIPKAQPGIHHELLQSPRALFQALSSMNIIFPWSFLGPSVQHADIITAIPAPSRYTRRLLPYPLLLPLTTSRYRVLGVASAIHHNALHELPRAFLLCLGILPRLGIATSHAIAAEKRHWELNRSGQYPRECHCPWPRK